MQFITLANQEELALLPAAIRDCIQRMRGQNVLTMKPGTYPVPGYALTDAYYMVMDLDTILFETRDPEVHRKYVDIQYIPQGNEVIGFAPDTGKNTLKPGTDPAELLRTRDILFYESAEHESRLVMPPESVLILWPWDVHRPACSLLAPARVRKAVGKVRVDLLLPGSGEHGSP